MGRPLPEQFEHLASRTRRCAVLRIQANVIKIGFTSLAPELPPWLICLVDAAQGQIAIVCRR
jgi:hypothetical protein